MRPLGRMSAIKKKHKIGNSKFKIKNIEGRGQNATEYVLWGIGSALKSVLKYRNSTHTEYPSAWVIPSIWEK